jgi:hypothetical protein
MMRMTDEIVSHPALGAREAHQLFVRHHTYAAPTTPVAASEAAPAPVAGASDDNIGANPALAARVAEPIRIEDVRVGDDMLTRPIVPMWTKMRLLPLSSARMNDIVGAAIYAICLRGSISPTGSVRSRHGSMPTPSAR